jgi:TolB-like protein
MPAAIFCLLFTVHSQDVITVLDLESDSTVSKYTIDSICNKINAELAKDTRFTTSDRQYLPFMIESLDFKRPTPCLNAQCLSEIGKQLGARFIIGGTVRIIKNDVKITLNYIDVENVTLLKTISSKTAMDKNTLLNVKIPELVQDLININNRIETPDAIVKKERKKHPGLLITAASTVAAGAAAAILYLRFSQDPVTAGEEGLSIDDIPIHIP